MRTLKFTIAYDGTRFVGWQRQAAGDSIQGLIEDALASLEGGPVTLHGAGRTDAGVHALGQVASATVACAHPVMTIMRAINAQLPEDIRVTHVEEMSSDFHARFSATGKTYRYQIVNDPAANPFVARLAWHIPDWLDRGAMQAAAAALVGTRDFSAFQSAGSATATTTRTLSRSEVREETTTLAGVSIPLLVYTVSGDGFLRHMVRAIVGTLVEIGRGQRRPESMGELSAGLARGAAGPTAPAHGLVPARERLVAPTRRGGLLCPPNRLMMRPMSLEKLLAWIPPGHPDEALTRQIQFDRLPAHVAIIMDGNGRWAAQRHLPRVEGHRAGIDAVRDTVETAARLGVEVLTLYAFSVENWKRPVAEVSTLMTLLKRYLRLELNTLLKNDIRFQVIGRVDELSPDVREELDTAVNRTADRHGMLFNIALNYGGRAEIVDAVRRAIESGMPPEDLDERRFGDLLYTAGQPDPDLLIRTSGEMRVSNFLLWQIAYAEIYVTDTLWPDFRRHHLLEAVVAYQKRERRYGGIKPSRAVAGAK